MDLSNIDLSSLPSLWETRQEEERKQRQQSSSADEFNNSPIVRASAAQETQRQREAIRLQEDEAAGRVGRMPRTNEEAGALIAGDQAALARDISTARQRGLPEDAIADATAAAETFKSRVQRDQGTPQQPAQGAPQQRAADPMTMWRQVEGHDIYAKASAKEREATRKDFFRRYVAPTVPTDQLVKARDEFMARTEEPGYGEVLKDGIDQLSVSARALKFTLDPKSQDESVAAELSRRLSQPARKSTGERRIEGAAQRVNEAEGFGDTASAIGGLLWEAITNPGGVSKMVVRNLPNAAPSLASTAIGAGTGAAAGSVVPVIGTAAGGVGGAIAGGFTGSALTEMGAYVEGAVGEELQKRGLQPTTENVSSVLKDQEFRDRISGEAQRKGVTIGAIDAITFGAAGRVGTAPLRNAVTKTLRSEGVDVGNRAAVRAALQDPAIATKVSEAVKAVPGWKQAAAAGGAGLVETGGEGLGEYAGTYAATGEAKLGDAIVESISSLGQSAGQAAISTSLQRSAQGLRAAAQALRNNDPVAAEDALGDVVPPTAPPPLLGYTEKREKVAPEDMEILDGKALPAPPAPPAPPPPPLQIEGTPKQTEIRADAQGNAVQLTPEQQMEADQKRAAQTEQQRAAEAEAAAINASESEKAAARVRATTEERQADAAAAQAVAPEIAAAGEGMGEMQPVTGRNQGAGGQQTMNIGEPEGKVAKPRAPKKPAAVKPQQEGLGLQTEDDIQTARDMERMDAEGGRGKASESRSYTNAKGLPAVDITAYHWSKAPRRTLSTGFYGTGLKGSAREEIINDPTVNKRLSFYVDKGTGVRPEAGVGGIAHKADLTNIYDGNTDPLKLRSGDARAFERKVQELGYNGYLDRMEGTQPGQVILLGNQSVDATVLGPRSQIEDGDRIEPLPQPAAKWETVNTMLPSQEAAEKIIAERRKQGKWVGYDMRVAPDGKLFKIETRKASQSKGATIRPVDPQKKAEIKKVVDAFNAKHKGTKYLQVKLLESVDDPQNDGLVQSRTTEGVYYGRTGEVALLVEALPDADRALEVLSHEIIGHHGVESLVADSVRGRNTTLQAEWNRLMDDVRRAMPEEIKESVRRGYTEAEAAREALARIAERGEKPGFVDRAIVILRKLARALGLKLRNNRADLVDLVARAARHVRNAENIVGIEIQDQPQEAVGKVSESKSPLGFFSALGRAVDDLNVKAMQPQDWITRINAMVKQGAVKADEVEWSGVTDWLALQKGKVTKDAVQEFLRGNGVKVEETVLGGASSRRFATKDEAVQYISDEGNMTPDEVMQEYGYRADEDYIRLAEQIASENGEASAESSKYGKYTLPGGTNYREVLLTLPDTSGVPIEKETRYQLWEDGEAISQGDATAAERWRSRNPNADIRPIGRETQTSRMARGKAGVYLSPHWDQPNVLAHIRLNDRTDADGNRVLFVEEIQSDWGQAGRKQGFRNAYKKQSSVEESNALRARMREAAEAEIRRRAPSLTDQELLTLTNTLPINDLAEFAGMQSEWADLLRRQMEDRNAEIRGLDQSIPAAPFVTKTEGWLNLALKRVMVMAAEGGYDKVAFVNGAQSSDRYDLSKRLERIDAKRKPNGEYNLDFATKDGRDFSRDVTESQLEDHVGKEMAKKIVDSTRETNKRVRFSGLDLKVGGEGMNTFYDTIVPTALKKLLPKVGGGQMQQVTIELNPNLRSRVAPADVGTPEDDGRGFWVGSKGKAWENQPGFDVTPEMKKQVDRGVPLFSKRAETVGGFEVKQNKDGTLLVKGEAEAIRAALPDDVRGRAVDGGLLFQNTAAPRVRAALEGRASTYSRAGQVIENPPTDKNGNYIGAPEKYKDSPQKLGALRRQLMKLAREGEAGRFWYEHSGAAILRMVGGNVQDAKKFVALLSIYSPQAKVDANSTFALRAWTQYKAGQPINVKTSVQDKKAQAAMDDIEAFWSGEKTGNFYFNLLRQIDTTTGDKQGATIDMWMMRAAEYDSDNPTATQYAFMENEINRVARDLGWEPQQAQAAIWVAMKARMEPKALTDEVDASSERKGYIRFENVKDEKTGKSRRTRIVIDEAKHRENWVTRALRYNPTKDDKAQAKFDFGDGVMRNVGQVSFEARPGRSTGVLPGIHSAGYELQQRFHQDVQKAFYDENGRDMLAEKLGLLVNEDVIAPGVWQGEVSPSTQKQVPMAPAKGGKLVRDNETWTMMTPDEADAAHPGWKKDDRFTLMGAVDPAQRKLLTIYASVAGLVAKQEGVGWHRPFYTTTKKDSNGVNIDIGRVLTNDEALAVERAVGQWMQDNGKATFTDDDGNVKSWNDRFAIISTDKGVRLITFGAATNAELQSGVLDAVAAVLPDSEHRLFGSDGDMPSNTWRSSPNGEDYVQRVRAEGRSDVLRWAATVLAPRVQSVFERYSKEQGWGDPGQAYQYQPEAGEQAGVDRGKGSESRTDTPEFRKWFGDSKVVDEDGKPLVVYHGTNKSFGAFDPKKVGSNFGYDKKGFFFTNKPRKADQFAAPFGMDDTGANVLPAYVSLQNPLTLERYTWQFETNPKVEIDDEGISLIDYFDNNRASIIREAEAQGLDGVLFEHKGEKLVVAFRPEQVKSVFNRGTWSPRTGKISESKPAAPQYKAPKQSGLIDALFRGVSKATFADTLTSWAYDRVTSLGSFVPEKVKQGLVSDYALPEPYLDAKIEKSAEINKVLRRTRNMLDMLAGLNREESRVAYLWMSEKPDTDTEKELLAKLPPASRDTLDNMKSLIDGLGREAVRVGLLSPDSYERNKMAYLHRSYTAHLAGKEEIGVRMRRNAAIRAENFKGRGLRHDVTDEALTKHTDEVREGDKFVRLEKRLPSGKLHRVVYVPVGEPVPAQYAGWGNDGVWEARFFDKKSKVGMWRDMTKAERERLGEVEEVRYAFAKTVMAGIRDIENMRFLDWVGRTYATEDVDPAKVVKPSESFLQAKTYAKDEWIKVPDTTIPGTKIKKYGNLTGKYIPAVIFSDIKNQMAFPESELGKLFNDLTSAWKVSKTALSPAVHTNNVMSNFIMADIADVRARDLVGALKVLVAWKRGDDKARKLVERFEDSGADYGSFAANEINTAFIEPLLKEIEDQENADLALLKWSQIINLAAHGEIKAAAKAASVKRATQMGAAPFKALIAAYQAEDTVFRLAKFMREVEAGATDQQAGKLAREAFLNYDINAPWVQAARRTVLPFVAFSYRAIPLMIQTAAKKPWKLAKYFTIGSLLNAASYAALGLSGEDEERERKMLPEELQGRLLGVFPRLVRHPWNDQYGSPVFQDVRNWVPAGNMFDVHQSQAATPLPSWLSASGPMSLFMELMLNKSAFTGKEIIKDTDTATEGMLKVTDHLFKFMAPNLPLPGPGTIIPGVDRGQLQTYATQALIDAGSGRTDAFGRDQSLGTAMLSNIGIKARAYPEDALTQRLVLDFKKKKAEIGANINALARERSRNGITEEQFNQRVAREQEKLQKAAEELQKKLR